MAMQQHILHFTNGHSHPFSPFVSQAALNDIRGFEMCRKLQSPSGLSIVKCDVINLARAFAEHIVVGVPFPAPWYSTFMHRVVILMAVTSRSTSPRIAQRHSKGVQVPVRPLSATV